MRPTAAELAATLGLEPHPEGGYFRETYRASETVITSRGERPLRERSSSPDRSPDRAAGDDSVTATTLGAVVTLGADMQPGYLVPCSAPTSGAVR